MKRISVAMIGMAALVNAWQNPTADAGGPAIRAGERFGVLHFTVRETYVVPQAITTEEGWYRIAVDDPSRVAAGVSANIHDDRGNALTAKALKSQGPKTSYYLRLNPGKHE